MNHQVGLCVNDKVLLIKTPQRVDLKLNIAGISLAVLSVANGDEGAVGIALAVV